MTPEALAEVHAAAFASGAPRAWTPAEIKTYLDSPNTRLFAHESGFLLIQTTGQEAEVLTLAVHPKAQRQGIAQSLLKSAMDALIAAEVAELFLEVSETNAPARALYRGLGFAEVGYRKNYYNGPKGKRVTAHVLRKRLFGVQNL